MSDNIKKVESIKLNLYNPKFLAYQLNFPIDHINKIRAFQLEKVRKFSVPKSSNPNQTREIIAPSKDYKILLKRINKNLLQKAHLPIGVCGGIINKKLFDMVKPHCGKEAVYIVDLKDFYPSISKGRVLKMFLNAGCSKEIANLLTDLVTFENSLPQGFPTSTMLANIIAKKLDIDHLSICNRFSINRTRWVDDIVFSGRIKDLQRAKYFIDKTISKNGFTLNINKQKFSMRKTVPTAVGLTLNKRNPYVPLKVIEYIESVIDFILKYGIEIAIEVYRTEFNKKDLLKSLEGKINFISEFNSKDASHLKILLNKIN